MQIFEHDSYRKYLKSWIANRPGNGRGEVSRLAGAAGCHVTYFSQMLHAKTDLSPEQAHRLNPVLGHNEFEADYFLLLVLLARAGTKQLKDHFLKKTESMRQQQLNLKSRIRSEEALSTEEKAVYYSNWHYIAVHIATSIPRLQTKASLSQELGISSRKVSQALAFLVSAGLVHDKAGKYIYRSGQMHLPSDSPLISQHHTNWRMKAIASLDSETTEEDLHYSSVVSVAERDIPKIKEILVEAIEKVRSVVRDSPEETLICYSLDAFSLRP